MTITKQELKKTVRTILFGVFAWFIALPTRQYILDNSPLKNTFIVGVIGILILLFWDG